MRAGMSVLVTLIAIVLASCGGSPGDAPASPEQISRAMAGIEVECDPSVLSANGGRPSGETTLQLDLLERATAHDEAAVDANGYLVKSWMADNEDLIQNCGIPSLDEAGDSVSPPVPPDEVVVQAFNALAKGDAEVFCSHLTRPGVEAFRNMMLQGAAAAEALDCEAMASLVHGASSQENLDGIFSVAVSEPEIANDEATVQVGHNELSVKLVVEGGGWKIEELPTSSELTDTALTR